MPYVHAQSRAVADNMLEFTTIAREAADGVDELAAELETSFPVEDRSFTVDELAEVQAVLERVESDGFTSEEIAQLTSLGLDEAQIEVLRADMTYWDVSSATPGDNVDDALNSLANGLRADADASEELFRSAAVAAGCTNAPPVASFTASPLQSSSAPVEVDFTDTSTSSDLDAIESRTWNFGDGVTAEGESTSHIYLANGTYTVTLTVCDYLECSQATKQIFVGTTPPPNEPPVASGDFLQTVKNTSGDIDVLANDFDL